MVKQENVVAQMRVEVEDGTYSLDATIKALRAADRRRDSEVPQTWRGVQARVLSASYNASGDHRCALLLDVGGGVCVEFNNLHCANIEERAKFAGALLRVLCVLNVADEPHRLRGFVGGCVFVILSPARKHAPVAVASVISSTRGGRDARCVISSLLLEERVRAAGRTKQAILEKEKP